MEDRLAMIGQDGWIRDSFIIDKKPTEVEIFRIKSIFRQIEEALMTIESLMRKSTISGIQFDTKRRIRKEQEHLLVLQESLRKIWGSNECLQLLFLLEITKIDRRTAKTLKGLSHS